MKAAAPRQLIALGLSVVVCAAGSAALVRPAFAADKSAQVVFPQGSEQPLSALQDIDVIEHLGDRVPGGLIFADGAGKPVSLDGFLFKGKPVLVTLGYHRCPMLCGLVLEGLVKTMKESGLMLGKDFHAVSISIDPNEDRKLMADQQTRILTMAMGAGATRADDWPFLMGNPAGATALAEAIGFKYKYDEQSKQFAHAAVAFVLTPEGKVSRYLYGVEYPSRDFKLAMLEAGGGRVGTSFDRVVLSCFRYDPVTRRYAPFVLGFMRIGASTVFFALATLLVVLWRKEISHEKATGGMNDLMRRMLWLPEQASTFAKPVDYLHYFVITVTMIVSIAVGLLAFFFFFKYRERRKRQSTPMVIPSVKFEVVVIGVPLFFFLLWFVQGFKDYIWYTSPPKNTMDVYVMGKKWMWKFAYPDGPNAIGTLHVPANRPVRLLMTSRDVIHSFFVPDFRVKQDVLPGRYTELWFEATTPGRYQILCTEYCGTWHSQMWGEVVVMPGPDFDSWLAEQKAGLTERVDSGGDDGPSFRGTLVEYGKRIAMAQGCLKCHSLDGSQHIGPTWLDMYLRKETLENGESIVADEAYMTDSMIDPRAKIVKGYKPVMPTYKGKLAAPEAAALVEFIKSLRSSNLQNLPAKEAVYEPVQRR